MEEKLSLGQAHEFEIAARSAGWKNGDFDALIKNRALLAKFLPVLRGQAEVKAVEHLINCDAAPFVPNGWSVAEEKEQVEDRATGNLAWDASKVRLHLDKRQKGSKYVMGNELRKALKGLPVMNANVLDYLLAHPELIPEEWKGKAVFFWGTVYRYSDGYLCVRYLDWFGGRWVWRYLWLGHVWHAGYPAAVLAS